MNTLITLKQQAVESAKKQDWQQAVDLNQEILKLDPDDTGTLNRLGVAFVQQHKLRKAKTTFNQILKIDKSNNLAKKHLRKLKSNQVSNAPSFSEDHFIEEPGKTKTVELHRLSSKQVLEQLSVGQICDLKPKNRYISIETAGIYVGALPEDLSFRLTKLINRGNEYSCRIRSHSATECSVHLKESLKSKKNANLHSFPTHKSQPSITINDVDEKFLLEENIPVQIVNIDSDKEKTLEEVTSK